MSDFPFCYGIKYQCTKKCVESLNSHKTEAHTVSETKVCAGQIMNHCVHINCI